MSTPRQKKRQTRSKGPPEEQGETDITIASERSTRSKRRKPRKSLEDAIRESKRNILKTNRQSDSGTTTAKSKQANIKKSNLKPTVDMKSTTKKGKKNDDLVRTPTPTLDPPGFTRQPSVDSVRTPQPDPPNSVSGMLIPDDPSLAPLGQEIIIGTRDNVTQNLDVKFVQDMFEHTRYLKKHTIPKKKHPIFGNKS